MSVSRKHMQFLLFIKLAAHFCSTPQSTSVTLNIYSAQLYPNNISVLDVIYSLVYTFIYTYVCDRTLAHFARVYGRTPISTCAHIYIILPIDMCCALHKIKKCKAMYESAL